MAHSENLFSSLWFALLLLSSWNASPVSGGGGMSSSSCQGSQADSWEQWERDQATASMSHREPCWKSGGFRIMFSNAVFSFTDIRGRRLRPKRTSVLLPVTKCPVWLELTEAQLPYKEFTFQTPCQHGMLKTAHSTTGQLWISVPCENLAVSEPHVHMLLFKLT